MCDDIQLRALVSGNFFLLLTVFLSWFFGFFVVVLFSEFCFPGHRWKILFCSFINRVKKTGFAWAKALAWSSR